MIHISNQSSQCACLTIDGQDAQTLLPGQARSYALPSVGTALITVKHRENSYAKADIAHLMVASSYTVALKDALSLTITREKIRFDLDGYYDTFALSAPDGEILGTTYSVSNVDGVRKQLKRHRLLSLLITDPLSDLLLDGIVDFGCFGSVLFYIGVAIAASIFHLWKYVILGFLALWALSAMAGWIVDITGTSLFKKTRLRDESSLAQLDKWTDPAYIAEYYAQPQRTPVVGKIEN